MVRWPNLRGVLFDLDGTLLDTLPDLALAANTLCAEQGCAPKDAKAYEPFVTGGSAKLVAFALDYQAHSSAEMDALKQRFLTLYRDNIAVHTTLFDGMNDLLDTLEQRGLTWGIVTNKHMAFTTPLIAAMGLAERAGCVISGDTTAYAKPHPEPLLHASERLHCAPNECVYIGDAATDIEAARRARMRALIASYGYIPPDSELGDWRADGILARPLDLLPWLDEHG